jgi:predicted permease
MPFLAQDVRFAVRALLKRPGFAILAILTLALGVGATTAIFTVVNAILLRPLPYREAGRLVHVHIRGGDGEVYPLPDSDFAAWRDRHEAFETISVVDSGQGFSLAGDGPPERVIALDVTDRFFAVLGVSAAIGRTFDPGADDPKAVRTVVLSDRFWQKHFHGDARVVGRQILLDGAPHTVIGVMPPSFSFERPDFDMWRAMAMQPPRRRGPFYTWGIARLKPGTDLVQANASLAVVAESLKRQYPGPNRWRFEVVPLKQQMVGDVSRILYLLFGAVACLLLIATANVANLLLARASSREREIAVRRAIGAGRGRIVTQLMTESLVLAAAAGATGLAVAAWGTRALLAMAPEGIPRISEVTMSGEVFVFALGAATLAGIAFGVAPALRASRTELVDALKDGRGGTASAGHRRTQRALVVAEIALAVMLSISAGLMMRSFAALKRVNPGFASSRVLAVLLSAPSSRYDTPQKVSAFYDAVEAKLRTLPSVQSVGSSVSLPPDQNAMTDNFLVEGQTLPPNQSAPVAPLLMADGGYFRTLGVPLVDGRFFDDRDTLDKPGVVIVNETLARRYFPGGRAVGRRLKDGGPERPNNPYMEIVGVVGDVKYEGLDTPPEPAFYLASAQSPQSRRFVILRTASDPRAAANPVRTAVAAIDREVAISRVWTMDELMSESMAPPRFRTALVAVFALSGLLLAAIGIYGVMAFAVAERTHELGLRVALGASSRDVLTLVLGEAILLAGAGVVLGLTGAAAGAKLLASLLFGVGPIDAVTFAATAGLLVATALVASYVPARRALAVDPMEALRYE